MFLSHHHSVANHDSLEINFTISIRIYECTGKVGNVHSAVRFARDPEIIGKKFWESLEP